MKSSFLLLGAAVVVGGFVPIQAVVNSRLGSMLGAGFPQKFTATIVSFTGGFVACWLLYIAVCLVMCGGVPKFETPLRQTPPFLWTGGLYGIVFVSAAILLVPRIGAAATIGGFLCGQMVTSVLFDHIGFQGTPRYPASPIRLAGVALMLTGLVLVLQKGERADAAEFPNAATETAPAGPPVSATTR